MKKILHLAGLFLCLSVFVGGCQKSTQPTPEPTPDVPSFAQSAEVSQAASPTEQTITEPPTSFQFDRFAIGETIGNEKSEGSFFMPEILRLNDSIYRMFYTVASPEGSEIKYADSKDLLTWEVKGTALKGASEKNDPQFMLGGASIIKHADGSFRMYYRATPWYEGISPYPLYQIYSAISSDATNFTKEAGVRISNHDNDAHSPFSLAGHGRFFQNEAGLYVAVFSANFTDDQGPSDLVLATSPDGLKWNTFQVLYKDWHDPTIIKHNGKYLMYATYLDERQGMAISDDGLHWSLEMQDIDLLDAGGNRLSEGKNGVADLGAISLANGRVMIFTNYGRPSRDIAIFQTTSIKK